MKKFSVLLALLFVAGTSYAQTAMYVSTAVDGVPSIICGATDTPGYTAFTATGNSKPYPIRAATVTEIHVYSAAGSTATVSIDVCDNQACTVYYSITSTLITDPSTTGEKWNVPWSPFVRIRVATYAAGTIRACITAQNQETGARVY